MTDRNHLNVSRREVLGAAAFGAAASMTGIGTSRYSFAQAKASADDLPDRPRGIQVLLPRDRVPLSFIIDDSTCLVNMGHFCTPQFAAAWPDRKEYKKPWKKWPREIPDSFVREFGEWCAEKGVKGKYSIVPNPACVGWLDRELPGWSRGELQSSLKLVRDLMLPNWDIHPEMITHTRVIDLKTGRPFAAINAGTMENSFPQQKKSVDELAAYLAYALRLLKNCDLPCEGVTTPGGFGNAVKDELGLAAGEAVRDVYGVDLPHYFKYVNMGDKSTEPTLEHLTGVGTADVRLTVNVPAGTGDWFGGWQGDTISEGDRYCNADASSGRMVDLIQRRQPAVMLCHWPGMYSHGTREGFIAFQKVVTSIAAKFASQTVWMKVSEIGRYWAAKKLTEIVRSDASTLKLTAPFATERFTLQIEGDGKTAGPIRLDHQGTSTSLREVANVELLEQGTWTSRGDSTLACFDLKKGKQELKFGA